MEEESKKFTVGKLISWFICALVIGLCLLVVVMSFVDADGSISDIIWTQEALTEYENNSDVFRVDYYKVYEKHYFTEDGYFSVAKIRYLPMIEQWQMTVRYNRSTIDNLNRDYGRSLNADDENFTFAFVDNNGEMYTDFKYKKTVKGRYTYYRIVLDDLSVIKLDEVKIRVYFADEIENGVYPEKYIGELPLYNSGMAMDEYKFAKELPKDNTPETSLLTSDQLLK